MLRVCTGVHCWSTILQAELSAEFLEDAECTACMMHPSSGLAGEGVQDAFPIPWVYLHYLIICTFSPNRFSCQTRACHDVHTYTERCCFSLTLCLSLPLPLILTRTLSGSLSLFRSLSLSHSHIHLYMQEYASLCMFLFLNKDTSPLHPHGQFATCSRELLAFDAT